MARWLSGKEYSLLLQRLEFGAWQLLWTTHNSCDSSSGHSVPSFAFADIFPQFTYSCTLTPICTNTESVKNKYLLFLFLLLLSFKEPGFLGRGLGSNWSDLVCWGDKVSWASWVHVPYSPIREIREVGLPDTQRAMLALSCKGQDNCSLCTPWLQARTSVAISAPQTHFSFFPLHPVPTHWAVWVWILFITLENDSKSLCL